MIRALADAQRIVFGPMVFQSVRAMMRLGMLEYLLTCNGCSRRDLQQKYGRYVADVLVESGVMTGVLAEDAQGEVTATEVAYCLAEDEMTRRNFNFVADVCYAGAERLSESLEQSRPCGLEVFGTWSTIYEGLSQLPEPARSSWFAFDHFYSDAFFAEAINLMQAHADLSLVFDVGGNTGKFARALLEQSAESVVTIVDLPEQSAMAQKNLAWAGERCHFAPVNVLSDTAWPSGATVVWMSQFLDCFSHEQIVSILRKAVTALAPGGSIFIAEPFIDKQTFETAAYILAQGSLYFTCMANGNSKFYTASEMIECVHEAGLILCAEWHALGKYQYSLLQCRQS